MKWMTGALVVAVLGVHGCAADDDETDPFVSGEVVVQGEHVLDFSASPEGGALVGEMHNLAFAIKDETPRVIVSEANSDTIQQPDVYLNYEKVRCDNAGVLESNARHIARVHSANVDVVTIQVNRGDIGSNGAEGGFCFGYRTVGGGWTWELEPITWTFEPGAQTHEVELPIHKERVDAIKVASTGARRPVVAIRYTTF